MIQRQTAQGTPRRRARSAVRLSRRCSGRRKGTARLSVAEDRLHTIALLLDMEKYPGEYREAVRLLSGR